MIGIDVIEPDCFAAEPDLETNFKLFGPVPKQARGLDATSRAFAEIATALDASRTRGHGKILVDV